MIDTVRDLIAAPSLLSDADLAKLSDSDLCSLLCRLEQWLVATQSEWDWRRHVQQEQAARAARRIA